MGWVGLKYERLPNYCYWCGHVSHGEKDCEMGLRNKGRLRKEDQQYGEWLQADSVRAIHKSVATISGAARSKVPWQKQTNLLSKVAHVVGEKSTCSVTANVHGEAGEKEDGGTVSVFMNDMDTGTVNAGRENVFQQALQKRGCSGCVFLGRVLKNAAQNCIKPRFLKTGLKDKRPSHVF